MPVLSHKIVTRDDLSLHEVVASLLEETVGSSLEEAAELSLADIVASSLEETVALSLADIVASLVHVVEYSVSELLLFHCSSFYLLFF